MADNYYSRGLQFGIHEFHFMDADTDVASMTLVTREKWVFYPIYMDKSIVEMQIGGVPLEIKLEWLVAAVLADLEEPLNVITASRTETLQCWGFGENIFLQMTEKDVKGSV